MKFFLKKVKIEKKILIIFSLLLVITQIFTALIAYFNIFRINEFSAKEMDNLSSNVLEVGESLIQSQIEDYLDSLSYSTSQSVNSVFKSVHDDILTVADSVSEIYKNPDNFKGFIPPLPEFSKSSKESDKNNGSFKAYAIDSSNKGSELLAYNVPAYTKYSNKIFKTNPESWSLLNNSQKGAIINNYSVVSSKDIPNNLYKEFLLLSNSKYILGPIFKNNPYISSVYMGTESGLFCKYSADNSPNRYDPRLREWYTSTKNAANNGDTSPVWQETYISSSTGKLCITCAKSFSNSKNEIIGVCAIDMDLEDVSKLITQSEFGDKGYNFIIDSDGKIIIKSNSNIESLNIERLELSAETIKDIQSKKRGIIDIEIDDNSYYTGYSPLSTPNWTICSMVQKEKANKPITEVHQIIKDSTNKSEDSINKGYVSIIMQFFIEFFICVVITYFVAMRLSKTISKPIVELSKKAKIIGEGNFSINIPVNSEDEVGELAGSFNIMMDNLKSYMQNLTRTVAEKEKIHSELLVAKKIQKSMMPYIFPAYPDRNDLDIYALLDPAKEVGGDFYDFFFIDDKHLALVIADVSDKGISAALFMVIAKILIKNQLQNGDSPSEVFKIINNKLCENNDAGMFVTCFLGILNTETGKLIYSNAGHNPPILYRCKENTHVTICDPHGFVLGGMSKLTYSQNEIYLFPGDILFLYTDGVTEAINNKGELFSQERLEKLVFDLVSHDCKVDSLVKSVRKEIEKFANGASRADDITMLAFKNINIESPKNINQKSDNIN